MPFPRPGSAVLQGLPRLRLLRGLWRAGLCACAYGTSCHNPAGLEELLQRVTSKPTMPTYSLDCVASHASATYRPGGRFGTVAVKVNERSPTTCSVLSAWMNSLSADQTYITSPLSFQMRRSYRWPLVKINVTGCACVLRNVRRA